MIEIAKINIIHLTKILSFLFLLFSCTKKVNAQSSNFIDSLLIQKMNEYQLPGLALGIVRGEQVYFQKSFGVTNIKTRQLLNEFSVFHTGSVSKLFTAQAILALIQKDKLSLESNLGALNLGLKFKDERIREITIRQLLEHQSGLPDLMFYQWRKQNTDSTAVESYFAKKPLKLQNQPGTVYKYSNLGYDLLALIIQKISGQTFVSYVKKNILLPNDMEVSDFRYFKIPDGYRVSPHTKNILGKVKVRKTYPYTREHAGSSTLNANIVELNRWMLKFMKDSVHETFLENADKNKKSALGFQLYAVQERLAIGHYGGDKGFRSFLMMEPSRKIGIVILSNADFNEDFRQDIVFTLYNLLKEQ